MFLWRSRPKTVPYGELLPVLLVTVAVLLIFMGVLHLMGRIPWCVCGFGLWTSDAWASDTSQHFADPYSSSHILHGIIFYWALYFFRKKIPLQYRFLIALLLEIAWEILENSPLIINRYRAATASLDYFGDSILNSTGDVLFALFGFWLAWKISWKWILALLIAVELLMLRLYRDNLTLNILMLIHPVQSIKEWQMIK